MIPIHTGLPCSLAFFPFFFVLLLTWQLYHVGILKLILKKKSKRTQKKRTGLGFIDPTDASGTKLIPDAAPLSIVVHEGSIPFIVLCGLYSIIS